MGSGWTTVDSTSSEPTILGMARLIAHLDMDAFYASVELLRYPELRGRAVVIGGGRDAQPRLLPDGTRSFSSLRNYVGRGVVTTSTYEARKLGVFSAMGMMKSAALAPDAVLLPVDFDEYRKYSRAFKAAVRSIAPIVEDRGIDEIYIDLSDLPGVHEDGGRSVGLALKAAVREATGLNCSIGITPNKLLSKIASELDKPDGLTLLDHADIPARIWPLAARKVNGIGPKAAAKLSALGIETIGDVAAAEPAFLIEHFGKSFGAWMHAAAHGRDERPVVTASEPESISRETTFDRDLHAVRDRDELGAIFTDLCTQARRRPVEEGLCGEDHRHQAALRRFPDRHPRPHPAGAHPRRPRDPARRRPVPEARRPRPAAAPARRARLGAAQGERPAEPVCAGAAPAAARPRRGRPSRTCRCSR